MQNYIFLFDLAAEIHYFSHVVTLKRYHNWCFGVNKRQTEARSGQVPQRSDFGILKHRFVAQRPDLGVTEFDF